MTDVWNTVTSKKKKKVGMIQKHAQNCKICSQKDHVFQNCPFRRFLTEGTLLVKKVHDINIPEVLQTKHFAESKLDGKKAMEISKNRKQISEKTGQKICQNDVFEVKKKLEDSKVLMKYILVATTIPGFDQWRGKAIVASKTKLNLYRCKTEKGTWNPGRPSRESYAIFEDKGSNYHLIKGFIAVENIIDIDEIDKIDKVRPHLRNRGA